MTRDFRAYWAAETTSVFGSMFTLTAVGVVAVETFDATASQIGLVTGAATVPALLFGMASGSLADRLARPRRALMLCDAIGSITVFGLAVGLWTGLATLWWLVGVSFVLGLLATIISPVYFTHLSTVVGTEPTALVQARARLQSGQYGARIAGRSAAGPVIAALGAAGGLVVDAVSYLVSFVLLASLRAPDRRAAPDCGAADPAVSAAAAAGARALWRHPFLRALVCYLIGLSVITGAVTTLTAPFLLRTLALPVPLYGLILGGPGVAGLIGSLVATRQVGRMGAARLVLLGFGGAAASMAILPAATGGPVTLSVVAALGVAVPILFGAIANVGLVGVMTSGVPARVMGRAVATMTTATTAATLVGALGGGLLGDLVGIRTALWLCAGLAVASLVCIVPAARAATDRVAAGQDTADTMAGGRAADATAGRRADG
jgi:MFS family permease